MGLFDFVKEIGHKLFNRDEEAAEKIKKHIEAMNPGITGLEVNYTNGVVSLAGQAASAEAMEKAVLMAGNVQGVSDVKIDGLQAPPVKEKIEYYIIKKETPFPPSPSSSTEKRTTIPRSSRPTARSSRTPTDFPRPENPHPTWLNSQTSTPLCFHSERREWRRR